MEAWLAPLLAVAFTAWGSPVSWMEVAGFAISLVMVVYNLRVNPVAWPLAILGSALYCALFFDSKLYGEAGLQLFFIVLAGWGWWQWLRGTTPTGEALQVRRLGTAGRWRLVVIMACTWPAMAWLLRHATNSDVPWWDAFPTAGSVIGQWLLGRKYVENWPVWLVVNVVSIALFAIKGLWLTVLLYGLLVVLSALGWRAWHQLATQRASA